MIVLLTDFGLKDSYVGTLKGVIKTINPRTEIVDLSHNVNSQDINEAAYILWSSYKYFPKNSIFLSLVDPGVGSERRIICIKTKKYFFISPDNGLLKYILVDEKKYKAFSITNKKYFLKNISNTFHGRDIFAPLAAYFSKGVKISSIGEKITFKKEKLFIEASEKTDYYNGEIIYIDKFGNLISNIRFNKPLDGSVLIAGNNIKSLSKSYFESHKKELIAYIGSSNLLEIAVKNGDAAQKYGLSIGMKMQFHINTE